jgi:hypothetical protein
MHSYRTHTGADPKPQRIEDKEYLAWIRKKPCVVCARKAVAHHEQITGRGIGIKASDYEVIPLCEACHKRRHDIGKYSFWYDHFFNQPIGSYVLGKSDVQVDFCLAKMIIGFLSEYIRGKNG